MRNQFFYTRTVRKQVVNAGTETSTEVIELFRDSFNLEMVIRSVTLPTGEVVVLLNDMHEQYTQEPVINTHTNKVKSFKEVKSVVQSEISLSVEDGRRFFEATNVGGYELSHSEERSNILRESNTVNLPVAEMNVTE